MVVADTLEALAAKLNIPPQNLKDTVEHYNSMARKGKDMDFGKGDSLYDRRFGDPSIQPNPCMAPLEKGPYYASAMYPGDIGTKGGILTDEWARALKTDGSVLEGLYATGNTTSSVMGRSYPGAGAHDCSFDDLWLRGRTPFGRGIGQGQGLKQLRAAKRLPAP